MTERRGARRPESPVPGQPSTREPRRLAELPYAAYLEPLTGPLRAGGSYDCVHVGDRELAEPDASGARFVESVVTATTVTGGRFRGARFRDVWCHSVRWVGSDLAESDWLDAELVQCAVAGVELYGAQLRRVLVHGGKLDSVNLRGAHLTEVAFVDCRLRDVDLAGARLDRVTFRGCTVEDVRLGGATLTDVDLRGATLAGVVDGVAALRGATIDTGQLHDLAPLLAAAFGITVADPPP